MFESSFGIYSSMDKARCLCFVYSVFFIHLLRGDNSPEVTLSTGRVQGLRVVSSVNRVYYSFRGIPYAAPPVGHLRFKAPEPPSSWNGTLEAFEIPPACPQPWRDLDYPERYREDCLYINVFTPHMQPPMGRLMPVMVWIHGGEHYQGSSTTFKYGPDYLVTEDIVLVSFNFRLGVFGYFNSNSSDAQGNAAAKDKVAALKWVQKEISLFGGDPNSVTIFGGSSGAQDVECLYLAPMAQGLFHKAISQSSLSCDTSYHELTLSAGRELAKLLGCSSPETEEGMKCLRGITADVLAEIQMEVATSDGPKNPFQLTVEGEFGEEQFFGVSPEELLTNIHSDIPYIIGMNSGEGRMFIRDPKEHPTFFTDMERDFKIQIPRYLRENVSMKKLKNMVKELKSFYFGDRPISKDTVQELSRFLMDSSFAYPIISQARHLSVRAPVYLYFFAFEGEFESNEYSNPLNVEGVSHGDELGYLFHRSILVPEQSHMLDYPRECQTLTRMVRLWTNFAKYGNPTPNETDVVLNVTWLLMHGTWTRHLVINDSLIMESSELLAERMAAWDKVLGWVDPPDHPRTSGFLILGFVSILALISLTFLIYDSFFTSGYQTL